MNLRMRELRERAGLTQLQIADRLEMLASTYGSWERGDRDFNLKDAVEIVKVLGCTLDELAGRNTPGSRIFDPTLEEILDGYHSFNSIGKSRLAEQTSIMRESKKYEKENISKGEMTGGSEASNTQGQGAQPVQDHPISQQKAVS